VKPPPCGRAVEGLWLELLGPVRGWLDGAELELGSPDQRAVLALLLLREGRLATAGEIIDAVWGEDAPRSVQGVLRTYVYRLRRLFSRMPGGDPLIQSVGGGYMLPAAGESVDVRVFEQSVAEGRRARQEGDPARAAVLLGEGLGLWQGTPLSGMRGPYADRQRQRLEQLHEGALEEYFAADVERGAHREVIPALTQAVADSPLRERLRELLMLALYRAGRQAEALDVYNDAYRVLDEELGIAPGAALRELHGAILRADPGLELPMGCDGPGPPPAPVPARLLPDAPDFAGLAKAQGLPHHQADRSPAPSLPAAATRTLPRDVATFIGRQRELEQLAEAAARAGGVVAIHAIGGMSGVGKTAFAVHAAHRLADRFPGGQIFLPLHGHTPGQRPVDPEDALASLLLTAGVATAQIPPGLEARMGLWRDRLAGRQLLLILDDAVDSKQVLPLLPGSEGSLVLVTSRRHLSALEGATAVSLDTLPPGEAGALLVRLAGRAGLDAEHPGVAELARLCGYLPLAIGMVARQLHHHPAWSVVGRAAELAAARHRLQLIVTENVSVAAAFDLSYADLTGEQQRLFRRLGLHPGAEFDAYAAAALDGTDLAEARQGLEGLYDQYLLAEPASGRYRMHDLIREHARTLTVRDDPDGDRERATARLLDYYQHAAARADARIDRLTRPGRAAADAAVPAAVPDLNDREEALAWARAERASLTACLDHATATGQHARVIVLTAGLAGLLRRDGPWAEAITRHETAIKAAKRLGDRLGQANALRDLGTVQRLTDDYPAAVQAQEEALDIFRDIGDRPGQATALFELGIARRMTEDYPASVQLLEQALDVFRDIGDRPGQANALSVVGSVRLETCDYPEVVQAQEEALDIFRDIGDRTGQATALCDLGAVRCLTGDYPAAVQAEEEALDIFRDIGPRIGEATALCDLGTVRRLTGDYPASVQLLEQALDIYRDLGNRIGEANALRDLGTVRRLTGDYPASVQLLEQALDIYRDIGDRAGETEALNERGELHRTGGAIAEAEGCHRQALDLARAIASSWGEAHALAGLGRCARASGHHAQARAFLQQALEIFQRAGAPEADDVSDELTTLSQAGPPATPTGQDADPGAAGVVIRPGLFQRLGGSARVSVVSAPPGSGKTVLLRSWIAQAGLGDNVGWVAAGRDDRDPQRFWLSVLNALRRTAAGSALVREVTAAPDLDGWAAVEQLLRNLAALRDPVWLVIDDVHELGPEVMRQLELLVLRAPRALRFVLATRQDVRLGLHRLRLEGGLAEIRAADLRFSPGEAGELFAAAGVNISESAVALLHERTEGWAAGLRLAALSLAGHPDPERFAKEFSGSDRTVTEYLLAEVLERQPEPVRRLLLRTSILERVNGKLADLLTGDDDGERVLQDLEEANAFVVSVDGARSWFRYHQMFAGLLALELRRTESGQVTRLHRAAGQWFADHGYPVEAIRHAQAAEDWDRAARLLADHWPGLHLDGQDAVTHVLLASFPAPVLAADAELGALIAADELAFGTLDEAERYLGLAERAAAVVPEARGAQAQLLLGIVRLLVARQRGNLLAEAQEAQRLRTVAGVHEAAAPTLGEELRALALISLGYAEGWTARSDPAGHLEQGIMLARRTGRSYLEFTGLAYQSAIEASRSLPGAEDHSSQAIELAEHHGWSDETAAGVAYTAHGGALAWQGRLDEAATWLHRADLAIKPEAEAVAALGVQYIRGQLLLARGQAADALATFQAAERLAGRLAAPHPFARPARAWLVSAMTRLGETERAEKFLAGLDERERESGGIRIATAALRLAQDDSVGALAELGPVLDDSVRVGWQTWLVGAFLLAAIARDALGDLEGAESTLERALDLAESGGALLWFLLHPVPELLERLMRHRTAHADLIAEIKIQLAEKYGGIAAPHTPARPTAPVSESELRVLRYLPTNLTVPEIAGELFVSPSTVRTHVRNLYSKLGVHHRTGAVGRARDLGLLAPSAVSLSQSG
jgi:LuxR family transcriptional regulator, maltose regulon positive regulatory protein